MRTGRFSSRFSFADNQLPVLFGRHRLIKRLGADPVGEFFLALWGVEEATEQPRVLRCIYPEIAEEGSFRGLFSDETRSFSWMSSDNVVSVVECGFVGEVPFIAHERVEGFSLRRFLDLLEDRSARCPWEISVFVAAEMYRGLDYVHRRKDPHGRHIGLTHGDVRPANVLLSFEGGVKLTNFSSALYEIVDKQTHTRLQTSRGLYLPPEGLEGKRSTEAGDLWGAAAVLWTMLNGAPPGGGNPLELGPWHPLPLRPSIPGLPDELDVFVARALSPDPKDRFTSAQKARDALVRVLSNHVSGHLPDNLRSWITEIGQADQDEEARLLEVSLTREPAGRVDSPPEQEQAWLKPGGVIDNRYRLLRKIGEGGMGIVFEAEHLELGRKVALKVLREPVYEDEISAQRFRAEARIMASLDHPAIVRVFDSGVTSTGYRYLAMELLSGQSMGDWIETKHKAGAAEVLGYAYIWRLVEIMAEACDGLAAAHEAKVVHRDFKPDNVFLTAAGPRILDFGIARRIDNMETGKLTLQGHICGTAEYVAPEQVGQAEPAAPMDIYAAGVIIYEALCGTTPFRQTTVMGTLDRVRKGDPEPPLKRIRRVKGFPDPTIPPELERICLRALRKNPTERFPSALHMGQALRDLLPELEARLSPNTARISPRRRIWPWVAVSSAAVLALALVGGYALVLSPRLTSMPSPPVSTPESPSWPKDNEPPAPRMAATSDHPTVAVLAETRPPEVDTSAQASAPASPRPSNPLSETAKPKPPEAAQEGTAKIDALVKQGNEALGRMDLSAAASSFSQATTADPRRPDAWYGLGKVRFEEGRAEEAAAHVEKALRLSPRRPAWRNFLGRVHAAMGNSQRAIGEWQAVLKTNPNNAEARRLLEKAGAL